MGGCAMAAGDFAVASFGVPDARTCLGDVRESMAMGRVDYL